MNAILNIIKLHAHNRPQSIAIEGDELHLSYGTLLNEIGALSDYFLKQEFRCIALLIDNGSAWAVFDLAAQMAGITLVPLPTFFSPDQIRHSLCDAGAEVLITDQTAQVSTLLSDCKQRPMQKIAGRNCWQIALPVSQFNHDALNGIAKITYTSGTTANAKGVCLTQATMDRVAHSLKQAIGVNAEDRHLCLLPLAVLLENIGGIYTPLLAGARCVIPSLNNVGMSGASGLDTQQMINAIRSADASTIILLPQMLQALINEVRMGAALPQRLRFIAVGGAPISHRLLDEAQALGLPVYEGYGLSECASVVAVNTPQHHRTGSVGKLLPHTQIKFSDEGEILLKGNLFNGYLNHPPRNSGWYASGDLGYLDSDGYLYLTGRKKSCFITSFGRNVAPEWVEKELILHPSIVQAAVFGEARPYNVAIIVPHPAIKKDTDQINAAIEEANRHLPDYAQVAHWLIAAEPFTIANQQFTATGRPRRDAIRRHYGERIDQLYISHSTETERSQHAILQ